MCVLYTIRGIRTVRSGVWPRTCMQTFGVRGGVRESEDKMMRVPFSPRTGASSGR